MDRFWKGNSISMRHHHGLVCRVVIQGFCAASGSYRCCRISMGVNVHSWVLELWLWYLISDGRLEALLEVLEGRFINAILIKMSFLHPL